MLLLQPQEEAQDTGGDSRAPAGRLIGFQLSINLPGHSSPQRGVKCAPCPGALRICGSSNQTLFPPLLLSANVSLCLTADFRS